MANALRARGRITARIPQTLQDTLQRAADITGATLNQFVIQAALREAECVIDKQQIIRLVKEDALALVKALESPFKPNKALKAALKKYQKRKKRDRDSVFNWKP